MLHFRLKIWARQRRVPLHLALALALLAGFSGFWAGPASAIGPLEIRPESKPETIKFNSPASQTASHSADKERDAGKKESGFFTRVGAYLGIGDDSSESEGSANAQNRSKSKDIAKDDDGDNESLKALENLYNFEAALAAREANPPVPNTPPVRGGTRAMDSQDKALYKKIFQLQENGNWAQADQLSTKLKDVRLRGHVLYQRYMHPTRYKSDYNELRNWMRLYADHPRSEDIYKLALARKPANAETYIPRPDKGGKIQGLHGEINLSGKRYNPQTARSYAQKQAARKTLSRIRSLSQRGSPTRALSTLSHSSAAQHLDPAEYDQARGLIAQGYYYAGLLQKAAQIARLGADRSGDKAPLAGWIAGLTAWRDGEFDEAAGYFEMTGRSAYADGWTASAGAYWAARAHMRAGNFPKVSIWLEKSARHHRTFYGLIANRALGRDIDMNWEIPALTSAHKQYIKNHKSGWRALALLEIGQIEKAERELIYLNPGRGNSKLKTALMALAQHYQMPSLSYRLASAYTDSQGRIYESGLYPLMNWEPRSGYKLDRALLHAFIRQESRFETQALSHSGATGLMQLMLRTASYIDGQRTFQAHNRHLLEHPSTNLDLGQKYIQKLLSYKQIQGDLLTLAVAYNAGPGNLARWKENEDISGDPLLFIESIPMAETRAFVERVLSNFWIYRMRLHQATPSLSDLAQDKWPIYRPQERNGLQMASVN